MMMITQAVNLVLQNLLKLCQMTTENTVQVPSYKNKNSPTTSVIEVSDDSECNNHRDLCETVKHLCESFISDGFSFGYQIQTNQQVNFQKIIADNC